MRALRRTLRTIDWLSLWSGRVVALMVPFMVLALAFEVISRYFFDHPTLWAQDVSVFLFGYVGLVGGAYVMRERAHINVDLFYGRMRPRWKAACDVATGLVALFFLALVVVYAWREAYRAFDLGLRRPTDWAPPVGPFIAAISLGGALLFLQTLANWLRNLHLLLLNRPLDDAFAETAQPAAVVADPGR